MKQKLLQLPVNQWYTLSGRTDRDNITKTLNELIAGGEWFKFSEDRERFMKCTFYEWPVSSNSLFDLSGEPGYQVLKQGIAEHLTYRGKTISIR